MKKLFRELFSESNKLSLMRVMSGFSLVVGTIIALIGIITKQNLTGVAELAGMFVISAFGGKVAQKAVEK